MLHVRFNPIRLLHEPSVSYYDNTTNTSRDQCRRKHMGCWSQIGCNIYSLSVTSSPVFFFFFIVWNCSCNLPSLFLPSSPPFFVWPPSRCQHPRRSPLSRNSWTMGMYCRFSPPSSSQVLTFCSEEVAKAINTSFSHPLSEQEAFGYALNLVLSHTYTHVHLVPALKELRAQQAYVLTHSLLF